MRWHGRLESETIGMRLADTQFALALVFSFGAGDPDAIRLLRGLLRRLKPRLIPHLG